MSERTLGDQFHVWFDSFEEFEREAPNLTARANAGNLDWLLASGRSGWIGVDDGFHGYMRRIREGWPEYERMVRKASTELEASLDTATVEAMQIDVRRRKRTRADHGDTLDIQRVWNGDLGRAWERPVRVPRRAPSQRYATIYVDLGASSSRHWSAGTWRAAVSMRICDLLTEAGFSTEIWVGGSSVHPFERGPRYCWTGMRAKEYMQPLNPDRLAALAAVSTLRTLGFHMKMCAPYRALTTMGSPLNRGLVLPLRERQSAGERVIRIGECWSLADAQREIAAVAESLKPEEKAHETV